MELKELIKGVKVKEIIGKPEFVGSSITLETIKVIERIDLSVTNNGIVYLSLTFTTQETINYIEN